MRLNVALVGAFKVKLSRRAQYINARDFQASDGISPILYNVRTCLLSLRGPKKQARNLKWSNKEKKAHRAAVICIATSVGFILTHYIFGLSRITHFYIIMWPVEPVIIALMLGPFRTRPFLTLAAGELGSLAAAHLFNGGIGGMAFWMGGATTIGAALLFIAIKRFIRGNGIFSSKYYAVYAILAIGSTIITGAIECLYFICFTKFPIYIPFISETASSSVGYILITPFLLMLNDGGHGGGNFHKPKLTTVAAMAGYCLMLLAAFSQTHILLIYLVPLGLMLVVYVSHRRGVAAAALLTAVVAIQESLGGVGPMNLFNGPMNEKILTLQLFLIVTAFSTMLMAALISEHTRLKSHLISSRSEAEAANKAKSVFLATMSHEIRTPLNGMLGMAQVLEMKGLTPDQRNDVGVIRSSGETLLSLLNDFLDMSKIEAGKLDLEVLVFDLGELLCATAHNFSPLVREKSLALAVDFVGAEGMFRGDPFRIRQILSNLISNALKFTSAGEIHLGAVYESGIVTLSVRDTGMGIPADKISKLFSKFTQVDETTTRRFGGTGLGLSICRELAELMGGTITVQSREGDGSHFTVKLPMERVGDCPAPTIASSENAVGSISAKLRILTAEDNPTNQLVIKTLLEQINVHTVVVSNGAEAVEAWEREAWDAILMDVQMPVMDGPTATRLIRAREAETGRQRTPIIALTANTMVHQVAQYALAGMDAHIPKPINAALLFKVLGDLGEPEAGKDLPVRSPAMLSP